ncbi:MAG: Peptidyl-prolyl cis-trans isomerase [Labilithrix sp.]|nr:Peptidyl-prolyl cis-trans isomerase [Labilithrix sp.]
MFRHSALALACALLVACSSSSTPEVPAAAASTEADAGDTRPMLLPGCPLDPGPLETKSGEESTIDWSGGVRKFTLEQALAGYPETEGVLTALITTEKGTIRCELDEAAAPITVTNFVGLARGTRPFKSANGTWKVGRFFDGLLWHRVIPDFVIQGGDPARNGTGGPGYTLPEENQVEEPTGTLAMAAARQPNGSQFFIVTGKGPGPNYNVFGKCETETAKVIAAEPRNRADKPLTDVHMQRIDIARCTK